MRHTESTAQPTGRRHLEGLTRLRGWTIAVSAGLLFSAGCQTARIGGTYIAHGENFVSMLQLTQTNTGKITGAIDDIELRTDGKLQPGRISITGGTLDGNQLTLTVSPGLFATNIAGTLTWNAIRLQAVGSNGDALSWDFHPSSSREFKTYADELKLKAEGAVLSATLLHRAQQLMQTVQSAEGWMSNAEAHSRRIPGVKGYYQKLEDEMRVGRTRAHDEQFRRANADFREGDSGEYRRHASRFTGGANVG